MLLFTVNRVTSIFFFCPNFFAIYTILQLLMALTPFKFAQDCVWREIIWDIGICPVLICCWLFGYNGQKKRGGAYITLNILVYHLSCNVGLKSSVTSRSQYQYLSYMHNKWKSWPRTALKPPPLSVSAHFLQTFDAFFFFTFEDFLILFTKF